MGGGGCWRRGEGGSAGATVNRRQLKQQRSSAAAAHARDGQAVSREALHAGAARALFQDLHAIAAVLAHGKAPLTIDDNTVGAVELAVAAAAAADGSNVGTVAVPQHLHAVVTEVRHKDVPCTVKGNAAGI